MQTFAFRSPYLRHIRLPVDITDAKRMLRRFLHWADLKNVTIHGLNKEESQLLCLWHIFIYKVGSNCKTNFVLCPTKKVSLRISTAFVRLALANKLLFISIYNMFKMSTLPPTFAIPPDFCAFLLQKSSHDQQNRCPLMIPKEHGTWCKRPLINLLCRFWKD